MLLRLMLGLVAAGMGVLSAALPPPGALPPHPRLLFSRNDLPVIQKRIANQSWAKGSFGKLKSQADDWLKQPVKLPDRGGQWYHCYSCPKHGARLRTESPTSHVCPVDQERFTGYPYDDVVVSGEHARWAEGLRVCGIVFQLSNKPEYAAKGREILLAYAANYARYPLHNTKGEAKVGGGKVGPQTLDESTWLISMVEGADCLWDTLSAAEQQRVTEDLLYPATAVIRQHKMGIHNIQCWKNSAVGLTGLLLGDMALVEEAISGASGYWQQMAKGVSADGAWFEHAWGYHFYTVAAVSRLVEGAFHSGINLYGPEYQRMFEAPLRLCMPDFRLPAFNDSQTVSVLGQASLYELAYARYPNERFRELAARGNRASVTALLGGVAEVGKPGSYAPQSGNFPASGNAVLAAGPGSNALWLCLDYGPHGGGHGHPDKLGFVLYGLGEILAPDPGTANYGVPIQAGWFRTSVAHNTLTVDEISQQPAEGACEAFLVTNGFRAVSTTAGKIGGDVVFRRTIALLEYHGLVFLDQAASATEHVYDFAYHNTGQLAAPPGGTPFQTPAKPGYSYLRQTRLYETANGFSLTFDLKRGQRTRWSAAGGRSMAFITGTGVGAHTEDRVPLVIARLKGKEAVLRWAVAVYPSSQLSVSSEPVALAGGTAPRESEAAAMRISSESATNILAVNASGRSLQIAGQAVEARLAWLQGGPDGKFRVIAAAR